MSNEIEKAELIQSLQAFLIPSSLFLATVISAAGGFLIYSGYSVGFALIAIALTVMIVSLTAFVRFQNKQRAQGRFNGTQNDPLNR